MKERVTNVPEDFCEFFPGAQEVIVDSLVKKKMDEGQLLRIKAGFDPTAPDLHLGHTVLFNQLKFLQDQGHTILVVIGDFTAKIGDPTGKNLARPPLSEEVVHSNTETYCSQIFKFLDSRKTQIFFNSHWLEELGATGLIRLASHYTVARVLERDDFQKRFRSGQPIAIHEFLYPLLQGYDSVHLAADIEIGGTDQKFNLLVGRELQRSFGQAPQGVVLLPLLEGTDGVHKMSKSLGNFIAVTDSPSDMFGKMMSISDELMWRYMALLSFFSLKEITELQRKVSLNEENPRNIKCVLAKKTVERYWSPDHAEEAEQAFVKQFVLREIPEDIPEHILILSENSPLTLVKALRLCSLVSSASEASRIIDQNGVRVDHNRVKEKAMILETGRYLLQVGKRKFCWLSVQ